ncbi:MAG: histidine ammonia-lyase [Gammaproteobacteria bacterium]
MSVLNITGRDLRLSDVVDYPAKRPRIELSSDATNAMSLSAATVSRVVIADKASYGINTGFGAFANRQISPEQVRKLQRNLVRSHATGVGEPLAADHVRRLMLLKANSLAAGFSGIRPDVVHTLIEFLNHDVLPIIPGRGSVGASGDLAPLAHMTLALIGEGEAIQNGQRLEGKDVPAAAGCEPIHLEAKEGLALLNGTQVSAALAMAGLESAQRLLTTSILAGALTVEGLAGSFQPFDERLHEARGMPGQKIVSARLRSLLTESEINSGHLECDRVQDPYAVRCMPQVFGAIKDTLDHSERILESECNGVSDNPLIFGDDVISGGNFHAEPIAFVSDFMAIAVTELGNIAERRIDLLARRVNPGLAMFLTNEPGLESGIMIAHVTAAALASENKTLAHPASVDSIPTSAGQEDHVSMAPWAGFKLLDICLNSARVLAIELMAGALALDAQQPLTTTPELQKLHARIRDVVPHVPGDHRLDGEIARITELINSGSLQELLPDRENVDS